MRKLVYIRKYEKNIMQDPTMLYVDDPEDFLENLTQRLNTKKIKPKIERYNNTIVVSWPFAQMKRK